MRRRENFLFLFVLILLVLALCIVLPVNNGILAGRGFQLGLDLKGGSYLLYQADLSKKDPSLTDAQAMAAVQSTIERRVNAYGVTEPIIQVQGNNRILVELPGVKDINQAISLIGQVALLEFKEEQFDANGNVEKDANGNIVWVPATATGSDGTTQETLTGKYLKPNAYVDTDSLGKPEVAFEWDTEGAKLFGEITTVLYNNGVNSKPLGIFLDNTLISAPTVDAVITDKGVINGVTLDQAKTLAIELNSGTLSVPLTVIQQTDVDATLGADSLRKSLTAGLIGIACVAFFMIAYYRLPGLVATVALGIYAAILLAIFKLIPITLTLPGIAGFVISTGMAVDANVLIFERMKEELKRGLTIKMAVQEGFHRAWPSIRDSNISTFITCIILYWFGNTFGAFEVKGFALTLFLGVAISLFSAITITRTFLTQMVNNGMMKTLTLYGVKHD
jgi:preprotein translocase subunit SecD